MRRIHQMIVMCAVVWADRNSREDDQTLPTDRAFTPRLQLEGRAPWLRVVHDTAAAAAAWLRVVRVGDGKHEFMSGTALSCYLHRCMWVYSGLSLPFSLYVYLQNSFCSNERSQRAPPIARAERAERYDVAVGVAGACVAPRRHPERASLPSVAPSSSSSDSEPLPDLLAVDGVMRPNE